MGKIKVKSLSYLAIPIFLELLLVQVVGKIDIIMLARVKENAENSVAVVGGMSQILDMQTVILGFINLATSILIAQFVGSNNKKKIQEIIGVSLLSNLILGILLGGVYLVACDKILQKMKISSELIILGRTYFKLVGGSCLFQGILLSCGAIMKSKGNPKIILFVNIGVNLLNIFGNWIFIFGKFGIEPMGINGAGFSTMISRGIGAIVAFLVMSHYCNFKFRKDIISLRMGKNMIGIGFPTAMEHLAWNFGQILIAIIVNSMGKEMMTVRTNLMIVSNFIMIFSIALGYATAVQVGQLIGSGHKDEAYERCYKSLKISLVLAVIISVGVFLFRNEIMKILVGKMDKDLIALSLKIFPFMIFVETGRVFNIVIINSLHAAGDIVFPMLIGIVFVFLIAVLFSYGLGIYFGLGLVGVWIANGLDEWTRGLIMFWRWKSKKWQKRSII